MSQCFLSEFKKAVDNSNLTKYGVITVSTVSGELSNYEGFIFIATRDNMPITLDIVQGHMYSDISHTTEITTTEISGGTSKNIFFSGNSKVEISNKYGIESIRYGSKTILNVEDLDYLNNGENVSLENTNRLTNPCAIGDLSKLNTRIQLVENSASQDNIVMFPIVAGTSDPTAYSKLYVPNGVIVNTIVGGGLSFSGLASTHADLALAYASVGNIANASKVIIVLGAGVISETSNLVFNFDSLSGLTNISNIAISGCQRTGDYVTLMKNNIGLVQLACTNGNQMDVESVLDYWAANGKTSNISFNGPVYAGSVSLNSKSVSFSGGSWQVVS